MRKAGEIDRPAKSRDGALKKRSGCENCLPLPTSGIFSKGAVFVGFHTKMTPLGQVPDDVGNCIRKEVVERGPCLRWCFVSVVYTVVRISVIPGVGTSREVTSWIIGEPRSMYMVTPGVHVRATSPPPVVCRHSFGSVHDEVSGTFL